MASKLGSGVLVTHWFPRVAAILALAALASGCGAADDRPGYVPVDEAGATTSNELDTNGSSKKRNTQRDECDVGDAEECRIELPSQGSVKNCVDGVRYCDEGKWSECEVN